MAWQYRANGFAASQILTDEQIETVCREVVDDTGIGHAPNPNMYAEVVRAAYLALHSPTFRAALNVRAVQYTLALEKANPHPEPPSDHFVHTCPSCLKLVRWDTIKGAYICVTCKEIHTFQEIESFIGNQLPSNPP